LFDRYRPEERENNDKKELTERAKERIEKILSQPRKKKLEERQIDELVKIIKRYEQETSAAI